MTVMEFFGCTFLAFGPPFSLFYFTIAKDPVRIIILIASAFFWLLSLLTSSLLWYIVVPLRDQLVFGLIFSVIFQETFRFVIYFLLKKAEGGLKKVTTDGNTQLVDNKHILAYVAGLGFGLMSGAFALINVLSDAAGPGTVGLRQGGDSQLFFVTSSLTTLCFIFLHTAWGVTFFHALNTKNYLLLVFVFTTHLGASLLTLLNSSHLYWASILPNYIILLICAWVAFRLAGGRITKQVFQSIPGPA